MKSKIYFLFAFVFTVSVSFAQRTPDWVTNIPTPGNNTYFYVVEFAFGNTELQARNQAIARVFQSTAMRLGQPINSEEINRAVQRGTSFDVISSQYNIPINKVCEYTENKSGNYKVYILCQVAKSATIPVQFDGFSACYEGANKFYAAEALTADGFGVYRNRNEIKEREVRSLFGNSQAYSYYEKGMNIYHSDFWNGNGKSGDSGAKILGWAGIAIGGMIGGIGSIVYLNQTLGGTSDDYDLSETFHKVAKFGWGVAAAGGSVLLIRLGVLSYGKSNVRKAVNMYNNGNLYAQNIKMDYGIAGTGVYITLNF